MYHIVHFHADGGQMCVPGRRVFTNQAEADAFADEMRNEPDHRCGPESVTQEESETDPGDLGMIYPELANMRRSTFAAVPDPRTPHRAFWSYLRRLLSRGCDA
jgi:hypothetical protein